MEQILQRVRLAVGVRFSFLATAKLRGCPGGKIAHGFSWAECAARVAGLSAIPPIRLTAPLGINREQQVMQQNQKLGTQPKPKTRERLLVPFLWQRKIFGRARNLFRGSGNRPQKTPRRTGALAFSDREREL